MEFCEQKSLKQLPETNLQEVQHEQLKSDAPAKIKKRSFKHFCFWHFFSKASLKLLLYLIICSDKHEVSQTAFTE